MRELCANCAVGSVSSVHRCRIFGDKLLVLRYSVPFVHLFVDERRCLCLICSEAVMPFKTWDANCSPLSEIVMLGRL